MVHAIRASGIKLCEMLHRLMTTHETTIYDLSAVPFPRSHAIMNIHGEAVQHFKSTLLPSCVFHFSANITLQSTTYRRQYFHRTTQCSLIIQCRPFPPHRAGVPKTDFRSWLQRFRVLSVTDSKWKCAIFGNQKWVQNLRIRTVYAVSFQNLSKPLSVPERILTTRNLAGVNGELRPKWNIYFALPFSGSQQENELFLPHQPF